jgi:hypothetical protein
MSGPLKCLHLSEENVGSGLYLYHNLEKKLADEKPSVQNIPFLIQNRAIQKNMHKMACGNSRTYEGWHKSNIFNFFQKM